MVGNVNNVQQNPHLPSFNVYLMALTLCQTFLWALGYSNEVRVPMLTKQITKKKNDFK